MLPVVAFQTYEIVLIVLAIFLLFGGATQIPKLAKALGRAKGEYQVARSEFDREARATEDSARAKASAAQAQEASRGPAEAGPNATTAHGGAPAAGMRRASDDEVRKAAREMGIDVEGRSMDDVRREIDRRLG